MKFNATDIQVLLESVKYSIQRVSDAPGTAYAVRQENLAHLGEVQEKLRRFARHLSA